MIELAKEYLDRFTDDRPMAMAAMVADLMLGDPASFKSGYTEPNAVIATAEAFDATREEVQAAVDAVRA